MLDANTFPFTHSPGTTYVVGGAVRDHLLGIPVKDHDWVVVGATSDLMLEAGFQQVGAEFPVYLHPITKEEYALARTERKKGIGYHGFICDFSPDVTLEQDLKRRDLTINAIACSRSGEFIDPYNGLADIHNKQLRHVSEAFSEDPLRVLRVARFAARFAKLGFTIAPDTLDLMRNIVQAGELSALTPERVWQETSRALQESLPAIYFKVLRSCGALEVLMPELDALFGIPQPKEHHPEIDCGEHALLSLEAACALSEDLSVRFAALTHDVGKACTPKHDWPKHHGHETAGLKPLKQLCKRLKVSNSVKELSVIACQYHTHVHRAFELRPETLLKVIKGCDALRKPDQFRAFLQVCKADARGRTGLEKAPYPQADYFSGALDVAKNIDVKTLLDKGLGGKELGDAIDRKRIDALAEHKRLTTSML